MSQKIALIACSKRKLGKNTPNQSFLAQDIAIFLKLPKKKD